MSSRTQFYILRNPLAGDVCIHVHNIHIYILTYRNNLKLLNSGYLWEMEWVNQSLYFWIAWFGENIHVNSYFGNQEKKSQLEIKIQLNNSECPAIWILPNFTTVGLWWVGLKFWLFQSLNLLSKWSKQAHRIG